MVLVLVLEAQLDQSDRMVRPLRPPCFVDRWKEKNGTARSLSLPSVQSPNPLGFVSLKWAAGKARGGQGGQAGNERPARRSGPTGPTPLRDSQLV